MIRLTTSDVTIGSSRASTPDGISKSFFSVLFSDKKIFDS